MTTKAFPGETTKNKPPVVMLAGPTGVGKTDLALELARHFKGEIINADSMQVYRFMDIGTAKPSRAKRLEVTHHLIDVVEPDEDFDAARYAAMAQPVIYALYNLGKVPLVVGGTGLYMKSLLYGICPAPPGNQAVRHQLKDELRVYGLSHLYEELQRCDPVLASRIHPNDRQRILRALEVFRTTHRPLSEWQRQHGFAHPRYHAIKIALYREREELYRRIDQRVHAMLNKGFLEEVKNLLERGYSPTLKPLQSLGYRQLIQYLLGKLSLSEAISEIQKQTRRYAKRQLTWFRGDAQYHWFHAEDLKTIISWIDTQFEITFEKSGYSLYDAQKMG